MEETGLKPAEPKPAAGPVHPAKGSKHRPRKKDPEAHGASEPADEPEVKDKKSLKAEVEALRRDLEAAKAEIEATAAFAGDRKREADELRDKYLRLLAEMDNARRRLDREKAEFLQFGLSDVLREVVYILDNFERALQAPLDTDPAGFRGGVELIGKQIQDLLRRRGVTPIDRPDGQFDPTVHQAVVSEESDSVEEPRIGEELQKGYLINDRLLRPALVKVLLPKGR
jgi:molecular chaperone GrpE